MPQLFASGAVAQIVLAVMALEAAALAWFFRSRPAALVPILANLASGACMVMALRAALLQSDWTFTAAWLCGSFAAHGAELALRLRPVPAASGAEENPRRELA